MARFLRDVTPNIMAGAVGVVLAIVIGVGVFLVVDASEGSKDNAPAVPAQSAAP